MKTRFFISFFALALIFSACSKDVFNDSETGSAGTRAQAVSTITWNGASDVAVAVDIAAVANQTRANASGPKITSNAHSADFPGIYFIWDTKQKDPGYLKVAAEVFDKYESFVLTSKESNNYWDFTIALQDGQTKTGDNCYVFFIPKVVEKDSKGKFFNINMVFISEFKEKKIVEPEGFKVNFYSLEQEFLFSVPMAPTGDGRFFVDGFAINSVLDELGIAAPDWKLKAGDIWWGYNDTPGADWWLYGNEFWIVDAANSFDHVLIDGWIWAPFTVANPFIATADIDVIPNVVAGVVPSDLNFNITVFHKVVGTEAFLVYEGVGETFANTQEEYIEWLNDVTGFELLNLYLAATRANDPASLSSVEGYVCVGVEKTGGDLANFNLTPKGADENISALITALESGHYEITFWYEPEQQ